MLISPMGGSGQEVGQPQNPGAQRWPGADRMVTAGSPWGWFLGYLLLGVTGPREPTAGTMRVFLCEVAVAGCDQGEAGGRHGQRITERDPALSGWLRVSSLGSLAWSGGSQIINGEDCVPHSQPWQAALFKGDEFFCSGVLVHPQWVLSAAHCLQSSYTVGLGLHSLEANQEPGSRMMEVLLSIQHPQYNDPFFANDLMLIKLKDSVAESDTIRKIGIASQCPAPGASCLVSGWGLLENGRLPKLLQCANVSVVPEKACRQLYSPLYHHSMFCAGGGQDQRDSCNGDSGGPLVCNRSLQGLVSLGQAKCGQPGMPSVYTNLCKFTDWIQKTIHVI